MQVLYSHLSSAKHCSNGKKYFYGTDVILDTDVTWKIVKPSPLAPLPQERGIRKYAAGEGVGG